MQGHRHEPNQETITDHSPNGSSNNDLFAVRVHREHILFKRTNNHQSRQSDRCSIYARHISPIPHYCRLF